jgi:glycosyltransferase involved in cell wall biosynthesis
MKLLIITQKIDVDDDILGFFHRWVEKFAENLDKVYVICLWEGKHNLPRNTHVYSLGKEKGYSKIRQLLRLEKFVFQNIRNVDGIFVHMCPIYAISVCPLAKIFRKKMILWYVHKSLNCKLKLCEKCVDEIFTASKQSCRLKNKEKMKVVGHGIDITRFHPDNVISLAPRFVILSVGRISPIKNLETLINAMGILVNQKGLKDIEMKIIGSPVNKKEEQYFKKIKQIVFDKKLENYVKFLGSVPNRLMPGHYQNSDLLINLTGTGSLDKVVLEAMSCGTLVLTCNEAFKGILNNRYLFKEKNSLDLAEKIINLKNQPQRYDNKLREIVVSNHNLDSLIKKIISVFKLLRQSRIITRSE